MARPNDEVLAPSESSTEDAGNTSAMAVAAELLKRTEDEPEVEAVEDDTNEASDTTDTPAETEDAEGDAEATVEEEGSDSDQEQPSEEEQPPEDPVLSKLPPELKEKIGKRIGKYTARAKTAEEALAAEKARVADLESQLAKAAETAAPVIVATDDDLLADVTSVDALEKRRSQIRTIKRTVAEALDDHPDEEEITIEGKTYQRPELKKILRRAERDLEESLPQREAWLKHNATATATAKQAFDWMKNTSSEQYQMMQAELKRRPHISRDPEAMWLVGLMIEGLGALKQRREAATKKKIPPTKTPPPVDATPKVAPPRRTVKAEAVREDARASKAASTNMGTDQLKNELLRRELSRTKT